MNLWNRINRSFKSLKYSFRRTKISVVHDEDLPSLITSMGLDDDIHNGRSQCEFCEEIINIDNLWGILIKEGRIQLICSNSDCLSELT